MPDSTDARPERKDAAYLTVDDRYTETFNRIKALLMELDSIVGERVVEAEEAVKAQGIEARVARLDVQADVEHKTVEQIRGY